MITKIPIIEHCGMLTERAKDGNGLRAYDQDRVEILEHCAVVGKDGRKVSFREHFRDLEKISEKYGLDRAIRYDIECTINHIKEIFDFLKFGDYD